VQWRMISRRCLFLILTKVLLYSGAKGRASLEVYLVFQKSISESQGALSQPGLNVAHARGREAAKKGRVNFILMSKTERKLEGAEESGKREKQAEYGGHTYTYDQGLATLAKPACGQSQTDTTEPESGTTRPSTLQSVVFAPARWVAITQPTVKAGCEQGALYGEEGRISLGCCPSVLGEEELRRELA